MILYRENISNNLKYQKLAYNKKIKLKSYGFSEKSLLDSKYIKTKYN